MRVRIAFVLLAGLGLSGLSLQTVTGPATVIDGDTIDIFGQRIDLHGIDAPELLQLCEADGVEYACGQKAAAALAEKVAGGEVRCVRKEPSPSGRFVAACFLGAEDLNAWLVSEGWAVPCRDCSGEYAEEQEAAKSGALGIWRGLFTPPWEWRRGSRSLRF